MVFDLAQYVKGLRNLAYSSCFDFSVNFVSRNFENLLIFFTSCIIKLLLPIETSLTVGSFV